MWMSNSISLCVLCSHRNGTNSFLASKMATDDGHVRSIYRCFFFCTASSVGVLALLANRLRVWILKRSWIPSIQINDIYWQILFCIIILRATLIALIVRHIFSPNILFASHETTFLVSSLNIIIISSPEEWKKILRTINDFGLKCGGACVCVCERRALISLARVKWGDASEKGKNKKEKNGREGEKKQMWRVTLSLWSEIHT